MSTVTITYSHAAPEIRERLIHAVGNAHAARTQRDRKAEFAKAYGYGAALDIMSRSGDQAPVEGLSDSALAQFRLNDYQLVLDFLGSVDRYESVMGMPAPTEATR